MHAGYIGSVSFLNTILEVINKLRSVNPNLTYGECIVVLLEQIL